MLTYKEGFVLVVEDSSTLWPVSLHASSLQVLVSRHEQEMIIHKLLADRLFHTSQWEVLSGKISLKLGKGILHEALHLKSLLLGNSRAQAKSLNASANTDSGALDWDIIINVAADLGGVHVTGVGGVSRDAMVLLDDGVEDLGEVLVAIPVSGVDAAVLVVELNGASTSLGDGEVAGLGLDVLDLVPSLLGHVLGDQGVLGLDVGEFSGHFEC